MNRNSTVACCRWVFVFNFEKKSFDFEFF